MNKMLQMKREKVRSKLKNLKSTYRLTQSLDVNKSMSCNEKRETQEPPGINRPGKQGFGDKS